MTVYLIYSLKVGALLVVFHLLFGLLLKRRNTHRLNRATLLLSFALAFVLPLCVVTLHKTVLLAAPPVPTTTATTITAIEPQAPSAAQRLLQALALVLVAGTLTRLLYINNVYRQLRRTINESEQHRMEDGVTLAVVDQPVAPFSWMRTIVLSRIDYEQRNPSVMVHERAHIRLRHSLDILLAETLTALQWFNPAAWCMRRDLRAIHEYEADAAVLSSGSDTSLYIQLLMQKATGIEACVLANGINNSMTKNRILMMLNKKTTHCAWLRALYMVPVVGVALAVNAHTVVDYQRAPSPASHHPSADIAATSTIGNDDNTPSAQAKTAADTQFINADTTNGSLKIVNPKIEIVASADDGKRPLVFVNGTEIPYDELVGISPDIIKSIDVVKNPEALKKYGPKAKDGAIFINIEDHPNQKGHEPFKVKGRVVDENQEPVIGAAITISGTKQGTVSDMEGNFSLTVTDDAIVNASYVGMATASFKADRATMAPRNGTAPVTTVVLKADGSNDKPVREYHGHVTYNTDKPDVVCIVDGQKMSTEEMMQSLKPEQIESMTVDKHDPKQGKIIVTTKK